MIFHGPLKIEQLMSRSQNGCHPLQRFRFRLTDVCLHVQHARNDRFVFCFSTLTYLKTLKKLPSKTLYATKLIVPTPISKPALSREPVDLAVLLSLKRRVFNPISYCITFVISIFVKVWPRKT